MPRLQWDLPRNRTYDRGVDRGVLYPLERPGVVWDGLVEVEEIYAGREADSAYFDGVKQRTTLTRSEFQARISAFSSPNEFAVSAGVVSLGRGLYATGQPKERFHFCYRSLVGNPLKDLSYAYKLHLIYNATATPTTVVRQTISTDVTPIILQWDIDTVPYLKREVAWFNSPQKHQLARQKTAYFPAAHITVDSRSFNPETLSLLEDVLYGTDDTAPEMPSPVEVIEILR